MLRRQSCGASGRAAASGSSRGCIGQKTRRPTIVSTAGISVSAASIISPTAIAITGPSDWYERRIANVSAPEAMRIVAPAEATAPPTPRIVRRIASCLSALRVSSSRKRAETKST